MRIVSTALAGLLLWSCLVQPAPAQTADVPGSNLQISILTFGPGKIYWERFGHDAILVRNTATGTAIDYNYGIFDFSQKNFFLNFARGYMIYRIAADPLSYDLQMYRQAGRSVTEQSLNLTPSQRLALSNFLRWNAQPENARYRYDYFLSNCATRVRDALNYALGGALKRQLESQPAPPGHTYRFDAVRLISPDLWLGLAMDIALGPAADRPLNLWQESFVPMVLSRALNNIRIVGQDGKSQPLVNHTDVLLPGRLPSPPTHPPRLTWPFLWLGLGLAVILFLLAQNRSPAARLVFTVLATAFSLVCGVGGLILAALWAFTQHWSGWHNENLLLFDPLCLLLLPCWIGAARANWGPGRFPYRVASIVALASIVACILRLLPWTFQANLHWVALMLPIHVALAASLRSRRSSVRRPGT